MVREREIFLNHFKYYSSFFLVVMCYKMKDTSGWQLMFESEVQSDDIYRLAITARSSASPSSTANQQSQESTSNLRESKLLAIAVRTNVRLWNIVDASIHTIIGTFAFGGPIDNLFFINSQLVATGDERKVGVWHSLSQQWQTQELTRILSFDTVRFGFIKKQKKKRKFHFLGWNIFITWK